MCVAISMEPGTQLSLDEVVKMSNANGDGAGFAWAEDGVVKWFKSVTYSPEYITKLINDHIGFFRLAHFRLSTVGGTRADLCHPFEVGPLANSAATGLGSRVLIHNGHWSRWNDIYDIYKAEGALPDFGPWSDSRLMAMLANEQLDWLDVVGGRVAVMDGDGTTQFWGDWSKLRDGILVSNKVWEGHNYGYRKHGRGGGGLSWKGQPWGMNEKEYEEYWRHQDDAKKEKSNEQKGEAQGAEGQKGEVKETTKGVFPQSQHRALSSHGDTQGHGHGGADGGGNGQGGHVLPSADGQGESGKAIARVDFTPWQNPATLKWYAVNPQTIGKRGGTGVMEISAEEAMRHMVQSSVASPEDGDARRHQGEGSDEGGAGSQ